MTIIDTSTVRYAVNPSPWLHQMREENPVCFDPDIVYYFGTKGGWQLFRYEDVKNGISNYELFSSEYIPKQKGGLGDSIAMTDPPRHKQLRSLISKAFAPAVIARMEGWIRAKCEKMLSAMQQPGKMDFIKDFAERPELQQHLAQHTEDIPKAINEVLRFRYPVLSVPRIARQELVLNGELIRKGDLVNCWLASANVDPAVFPSPDTFNIYRDNHAKILSFGHGIHGCIGALLTKLEARVVFETVFKHTQNIALAPENVLKRLPNVSTFKFGSLLVEFN